MAKLLPFTLITVFFPPVACTNIIGHVAKNPLGVPGGFRTNLRTHNSRDLYSSKLLRGYWEEYFISLFHRNLTALVNSYSNDFVIHVYDEARGKMLNLTQPHQIKDYYRDLFGSLDNTTDFKPLLIELDAKIRYSWKDSGGLVFFVWSSHKSGIEYAIEMIAFNVEGKVSRHHVVVVCHERSDARCSTRFGRLRSDAHSQKREFTKTNATSDSPAVENSHPSENRTGISEYPAAELPPPTEISENVPKEISPPSVTQENPPNESTPTKSTAENPPMESNVTSENLPPEPALPNITSENPPAEPASPNVTAENISTDPSLPNTTSENSTNELTPSSITPENPATPPILQNSETPPPEPALKNRTSENPPIEPPPPSEALADPPAEPAPANITPKNPPGEPALPNVTPENPPAKPSESSPVEQAPVNVTPPAEPALPNVTPENPPAKPAPPNVTSESSPVEHAPVNVMTENPPAESISPSITSDNPTPESASPNMIPENPPAELAPPEATPENSPAELAPPNATSENPPALQANTPADILPGTPSSVNTTIEIPPEGTPPPRVMSTDNASEPSPSIESVPQKPVDTQLSDSDTLVSNEPDTSNTPAARKPMPPVDPLAAGLYRVDPLPIHLVKKSKRKSRDPKPDFLKDYQEDSVIRFFDLRTQVLKTFTGVKSAREAFNMFWGKMPKKGPTIRCHSEISSTDGNALQLMVWEDKDDAFDFGTDSFLYGPNGKIIRQFIVAHNTDGAWLEGPSDVSTSDEKPIEHARRILKDIIDEVSFGQNSSKDFSYQPEESLSHRALRRRSSQFP